MKRSSVTILIIWLLSIIMGAALLLNLPDAGALSIYGGQALAYALLTGFTLYFGVLLAEGELSPAHAIGMVAYLSLPRPALPLMLWATFLGGVMGGIALVLRHQDVALRRRVTARTARSVVAISARVTLSLLVAAQVHAAFGGSPPIYTPLSDEVVPLLAFALVYCLIYLLIFILEHYSDGRSVTRLRENRFLIAAILLLPVPFVILASLVLAISWASLLFFAVGAMLVVLGVHVLSRVQYQLRKQVDELRSISVVGQALQSDLKLSSLLQTIYNQVAELLNVNHFAAALYEPGTRTLRFPLVIRGGDVGQVEGERSLLQHVMDTQASLLIADNVADTTHELGLQYPGADVESWLGVPLLAGGKLLGALAVSSHDAQQHFSPDDLRLLTIVAASAGVAIDNAQLYEQQTARANQLTTLNRILALLTGTLSPDEVIDAVLSSASVISEATGAAIYLYWDEAQQTLALVRSAGLSDTFAADPPEPILTRPSQKAIFVSDAAQDSRAYRYRKILTRENKNAWAELPLAVGENALGTLVLYFDTPQNFTEEQIEILRAFTNQAAQAIKNARLYTTTDRALERRAEQMVALATLGRQLTATMNLRSICNLVLARALELTDASQGFIALQENNSLNITAQNGYPPMGLNDIQVMQTITGQVLGTGQTIRYDDVRTQNRLPPLLVTTRSQLSVPILRSGQTLGVITLESDRSGAFSEEDGNFVTQLASQTIIAIDSARLFERIAEARDRMQVILNAMTDAIVLVDKNGVIALANPRVDLLGLHPRQLVNHNIDDLLERPELDLAERMGFQSDQKVRKLLKALRTPGGWAEVDAASFTIDADQGSIYIKREVIPVGGDNGEPLGMLLVFYDETEERELGQMRDDLSNMIVHDLRSPLTAVTTGLKLLRDYVPADSPFRPLVLSTTETSQRAIRKLLSRVDSLLDISRMESGQLNLETEPTELATLADSVCMELSPLAHELDVTVTSQINGELPLLDIDADKVERVLQNLVDNALKFCPSKGSVTIRAYRPATSGAPDGFARIDVVDTGPGVPDDYKTRLFERFVQVKGRRGARRGIGLGLTFCRLVTEAHGGKIWVEDNPAGGSIFAFTLPVVQVRTED